MHLAAVLARVRVVRLGDQLRLAAQAHAGEVVAEHRESDREVRGDVGANRRDLLEAHRDVERVDRDRLDRDRIDPDRDLRDIGDMGDVYPERGREDVDIQGILEVEIDVHALAHPPPLRAGSAPRWPRRSNVVSVGRPN
jgi:hypothetical protein